MRLLMHHIRSLRDPRARGALLYGLVSLVILLCSPFSVQAQWTLLDGARVHPDYHGPVPKKSDVIFSSRSKRLEALEVIRAYKANRVEWCYSDDKEFVQQVREAVGWFGGAINSTIRPEGGGHARDIEGNTIIAPWMKPWGSPWITTTNSDTRNTLLRKSKRFIERGADSIQVDDPLMQLAAVRWGGDFSWGTLQGFAKYLKENPEKARLLGVSAYRQDSFDYKEYLASQFRITTLAEYLKQYTKLPSTSVWASYIRSTVRDFYIWYRSELNKETSRKFPVSMNLVGLSRPDETRAFFFLSEFADYAVAETPISDPIDVMLRAATLRALGIGYVPSLLPKTKDENRKALALLYSIGAQPLVPWDVYVGTGDDQKPKRFYGDPRDYADMYLFVRANQRAFDDLELAATVGVVVPVHKYHEAETVALVRKLFDNNVPFAFVLTGGIERKLSLDAEKIKNFRALITVNQEADFSHEDMTAVLHSGIQLFDRSQLSEADIQGFSPFFSAAGKLIPRAPAASSKNRLAVHILHDQKSIRAGRDAKGCSQSVGLKSSYIEGLKISHARWRTIDGDVAVKFSETSEGLLIESNSCLDWGVLELALAREVGLIK